MFIKRRVWGLIAIVILCVAILLPSCTSAPATTPTATPTPTSTPTTTPTPTPTPTPSPTPSTTEFVAQLIGFEEVPAITTQAQGQAIFQLSADGMELSYKLVAANIQNVTQAHIHLAAKGANGPVVAWLYPSGPPATKIPGTFDGVLGEGKIAAANLVGTLAGQPLNALIDKMKAGEAYANIHTEQAPAGEIRGQIYLKGTSPMNPLTSEVAGMVTDITGNNVTVDSGTRIVTVTRDNNTKIDTADVGSTGQLAIGSAVRVYFDPATFIASIIELEKPGDVVPAPGTTTVTGTVVSVSSMYIVVKTDVGQQLLVEMLSGTTLQFEDGTPAIRTDIKAGVVIEATVRTGARWATRIEIKK